MLALPNFSKTCEIEYDDLGIHIGVVLMQEQRPIAYFNEKLNGAILNYPTYDRDVCIGESIGDMAALPMA